MVGPDRTFLFDEDPATGPFLGMLEPRRFQFAGFDDQCHSDGDSLVWDMVVTECKLPDGNHGASSDIVVTTSCRSVWSGRDNHRIIFIPPLGTCTHGVQYTVSLLRVVLSLCVMLVVYLFRESAATSAHVHSGIPARGLHALCHVHTCLPVPLDLVSIISYFSFKG